MDGNEMVIGAFLFIAMLLILIALLMILDYIRF